MMSIRRRLARAVLVISLVGGLTVALAVGSLLGHEIDDFLDDNLQESAEILHGVLALQGGLPPPERAPGGVLPAAPHHENQAWQLVDAQGRLLLRSHAAPAEPLVVVGPQFDEGSFSDVEARWRVYTLPLQQADAGRGRLWLSVAQPIRERREARAISTALVLAATLAIGGLCALGLGWRVGRELQPLAELSKAVQAYDPLQPAQALPPTTRVELAPMRDAIDELGRRLARRVEHERAFTAHAAHVLRTPLAGMDSQLLVVLRDCADPARDRLLRAREALGRLRRVVDALLTLFRSGSEPRWVRLSLAELFDSLPGSPLALELLDDRSFVADHDLLAAALINLMDNAQRHGASVLRLQALAEPGGGVRLRLADDGRGLAAAERERLQAALDGPDYSRLGGLGLMLADRVARAHGGRLQLEAAERGCTLSLTLGPAPESARSAAA